MNNFFTFHLFFEKEKPKLSLLMRFSNESDEKNLTFNSVEYPGWWGIFHKCSSILASLLHSGIQWKKVNSLQFWK